MATILRPPLILRLWSRDPAGVAVRAYTDTTSENQILGALKGQDRVYGAPGQVPDYDWPNPQQPRRCVALGTIAASFLLTLTTVAPPFIQRDFPVPRGPAPTHLRTWTDSFKLPLTTVRPPSQLRDWPNPRGKSPTHLSVTTVWGSTFAAAATEAAVFTAGGGFSSWGELAWGDSELETTASSAPFAQLDFPNPRAPSRSTDLLSWLQTGYLEEFGEPFCQADWPNPLGARRSPQDWQIDFALPLTTVRGFNQFDWPVPKGPAPLNRGWLDSFKLPLTTLVGSNQYDWPVPRGAAPLNRGVTDSFKLPLTTIVGSNKYDWPNPRGYQRSVDLISWSQTGYLEEFGEPFNQTDWPVPRGPAPLNRGAADSFKLALTTVVGSNQRDWPNPQLPRRSEQLGFTQPSLALNTAIVYPAAITFDWPNPRAARPGITLGTWTDSFKLPLTTVVSFSQLDWPNPRGSTRSEQLGGSQQSGISLLTATPVVPPVVVEEAPTGDWLPTARDFDVYKRHLAALEEAQERSKRYRKKLEDRLDGTIRRAYLKASGQEVIARAVVEAVEAVAPETVTRTPETPVPTIDWRMFFQSAGALERLTEILDRELRRLEQAHQEWADIEAVILLISS